MFRAIVAVFAIASVIVFVKPEGVTATHTLHMQGSTAKYHVIATDRHAHVQLIYNVRRNRMGLRPYMREYPKLDLTWKVTDATPIGPYMFVGAGCHFNAFLGKEWDPHNSVFIQGEVELYWRPKTSVKLDTRYQITCTSLTTGAWLLPMP